jgi:hypothetical protein
MLYNATDKLLKGLFNLLERAQSVGEFSADATRWALADAGDGMDDANFETSIANASILRMTKELVFIEESLSAQSGVRVQDGGYLMSARFGAARYGHLSCAWFDLPQSLKPVVCCTQLSGLSGSATMQTLCPLWALLAACQSKTILLPGRCSEIVL